MYTSLHISTQNSACQLALQKYVKSKLNLVKCSILNLKCFQTCQGHKIASYEVNFCCYGRPLLQAWLLPNLDTIPDNCIMENSL